MIESWTFRRDRIGETWHLVPTGEYGENGRAACGEPLQGTQLLEGHSATEPSSPRRCASTVRSKLQLYACGGGGPVASGLPRPEPTWGASGGLTHGGIGRE